MSDYNLGTASGKIEVDGKGAALGFGVAKSAANSFFTVVQAKMSSVQSLGRKMAAVGTAGTIGFGAAIKVAADFEQEMSAVQAVTNASGKEFDDLKQKAIQLGAQTVFSSREAASAIEELAKAGIPVKDILNGAAEAAVNLAAAGGVDLASAADISANAMNAFDLSAKQVVNIADVLAGVANTSAADVSGLGQSLQQSGAVAHLAGLSFRDTAIALGEMADAGIQGSDSGTSLKTMLNNLIPTTQKQIQKFEDLGILTNNLGDANKALAKITGQGPVKTFGEAEKALADYVDEMDLGKKGTVKNQKAVQNLMLQYGGLKNAFFDAKGDIKDLGGLQGVLEKSLRGMTKQQKLSSLETLFGADAMRASAILSLAGAKGYDKFSKAVAKTKAADVAKTRLNNLDGAIENFKGSFEAAQIAIGSVFLPMITKMVSALTALINVFNGLPGPVKTAIAVLGAILSIGLLVTGMILAMLPLILTWVANFLLMRSLSIVVGSLRAVFAAIRGGVPVMEAATIGTQRLATGFSTLGSRSLFAAKLMTRAAKIIRLAWLIATGPIGIAIGVIIALVALGVLLYKKWKPFHDLVDKIAVVLRASLGAALAWLLPKLKAIGEAFVRFGEFILKSVGPAISQVKDLLTGALGDAFKEISDSVSKDLMPALQDLSDAFNGNIKPALRDTMNFLGPLASAIGGLLVTQFLQLLSVLKVVAGFIITRVAPIFVTVLGQAILTMIRALTMTITSIIKIIAGVIQIFAGFVNIIRGLFTGDWNRVWQGVKQVFSGAWKVIVGLFRLSVAIIWNVARTLFANLHGIVGKGIAAVYNIWKSTWQRILTFLFGIMGQLQSGIGRGISSIVSIVAHLPGQLLGALAGIASDFYNAGVEMISMLAQGIRDKIGDAVNAIKEGAGKLASFIPGSPVKDGPLKSLNDGHSGQEIINFLADGIRKRQGHAVAAAHAAAGAISDAFNTSAALNNPALSAVAGATGSGAATRVTGRTARTARIAAKRRQNSKMRMVEGTLRLDRSGKAFIRGVAEEVVDDNESYKARSGRTRKGDK